MALTCGASADPLIEPFEKGPYAVGFTSFTIEDPSGRVNYKGERYTLSVDAVYPVDSEYADSPGKVFVVEIEKGTLITVTPDHIRNAGFIAPLDGPPISSGGPFPLVITNGGDFGLSTTDHFFTNIELASHGFVVVTAARTADVSSPSDKITLLDRPKDVSLLIDVMLSKNSDASDLFYNCLDRESIGVSGWSFGGFATLAVAGGYTDKYDANGIYDPLNTAGEARERITPDKRVKAIIMLDGSHTVFYRPPHILLTDEELAAIEIPTLIMGEHRVKLRNVEESLPAPLPFGQGLETVNTRAFNLISARKKFLVEVKGSEHSTFGTIICDQILFARANPDLAPGLADKLLSTFRQCNSANPDPFHPGVMYVGAREGRRLFNLYTVAFLKQYLQGDNRYNHYLNRGYAVSHRLAVDFSK